MKIRVKDYEVNYLPFIEYHKNNKDDKTTAEIISTFAVYSGCPIIVVICFAERFLEAEELEDYKAAIIDFYKYTEIDDG